jgi:hypothetical protein
METKIYRWKNKLFIVQRYDWREVGADMPFNAVVKTTMVFENEDYCKLMLKMLKSIDFSGLAEKFKGLDISQILGGEND